MQRSLAEYSLWGHKELDMAEETAQTLGVSVDTFLRQLLCLTEDDQVSIGRSSYHYHSRPHLREAIVYLQSTLGW